jgi:hypothetical protein
MGVVGDTASGPADQKFLRRFFQKAATFLPRKAALPQRGKNSHFPPALFRRISY